MEERRQGQDNAIGTSENRRRILEYIRSNPGIYLRKISKDLDLAVGNTEYHVCALQREGMIRSLRYGLYRHYYSVEIGELQHQMILALLTYKTTRDILLHLVEHPGSGQNQIAKFKQLSSPTINWHMSRMISWDIIVGVRDGRTIRYYIRDVGSLIHVLSNYYPNIWKSIAPRLVEMFVKTASIVR